MLPATSCLPDFRKVNNMRKMPLAVLLGLCLHASLGIASEDQSKVTTQEPKPTNSSLSEPTLTQRVDQMWEVTWKRFYLPQTHLFYDYLTSYEPGRELAHLPTADEVRRQDPNECGYGTGMEDCMISAGTMLSLIVDRHVVTHEEELRARARDVVAGIRLCATAHGDNYKHDKNRLGNGLAGLISEDA